MWLVCRVNFCKTIPCGRAIKNLASVQSCNRFQLRSNAGLTQLFQDAYALLFLPTAHTSMLQQMNSAQVHCCCVHAIHYLWSTQIKGTFSRVDLPGGLKERLILVHSFEVKLSHSELNTCFSGRTDPVAG